MLSLLEIASAYGFEWGILIPIVAILGGCAIQLAKVLQPRGGALNREERAKVKRLAELLAQMEARVAVLETLLADAKKRENSSHEKTL